MEACLPFIDGFFLKVEDMLVAFHKWTEKFEVAPSIAAYDKIISLCCKSSMVS